MRQLIEKGLVFEKTIQILGGFKNELRLIKCRFTDSGPATLIHSPGHKVPDGPVSG